MTKLFYAFGLAGLIATGPLWAIESGKTANENLQQGAANVKEGTREAAQGLEKAAEKVGEKTAEVGKKVGRSIKAATCPIVGNRKTKLYYAKDSRSYEQVLDGQKFFEDDDRSCFMTEQAARDDGYTRSAN